MNCRKSMVAPKPMQARCYCKIDVFSFEDIVVVEEPNLCKAVVIEIPCVQLHCPL